MPSYTAGGGNVLYLIASAAPPTAQLPRLVTALQHDRWDVCVIVTPAAVAWADVTALTALSGHLVRSEFRQPTDPEFMPLGDAVLVCPATFNTINKWALGINDSLALGLLNEALGRQVPTVVLPWLNDALANHPAYHRSLEVLDRPCVSVLPTRSIDIMQDPAGLLSYLPPRTTEEAPPPDRKTRTARVPG